MFSYGIVEFGGIMGVSTPTPPAPTPTTSVISIFINSVDRTNQVDWESVEISQELTKNSDKASFSIKNYGSKTYNPSDGDEVVILQDSTRKFAGKVIQIDSENAGRAQQYHISCLSYLVDLNSRLVSKTYTSVPASAIIADLLSSFTDGSFTMANVACDDIISNVVFNYITISECLKKLVSLLPGFDWYLDYNKDLHFFKIGTINAPFNLDDSGGKFVFNSLTLESDISQLANDIIIRGGKVIGTSERTEYFSGDTTRTNFPLGNDFNTVPTVVVDGSTLTVGTDGVDKDSAFQAMWNQNSQLIRFTSGNTPAAGTNNISVTGFPRFPLIYEKQSQASISLYGQKEKIINDKTIEDIATASARAGAELAFYAFPTGSAQFTTYQDGLEVGQYINITSSVRNINQNYKIQQIAIRMRSPTAFIYDVQLQTAATLNINDVLNLLLIQNPANQNPTDPNTVIERISLFEESINVDDTLHTPTKTSPPYVWDTMKWDLFTWS